MRSATRASLPACLFLLGVGAAPAPAPVPVPAPAPAPAPAPTGTIQGKVITADGQPFAFVDVVLEPEQGSTYSDVTLSDEDGAFRFAAVPVGSYKLSAFADGFKAKEMIANIGVTAGSSQRFTITLMPIAAESVVLVVNASIPDILDVRASDTSSSRSDQFISKIPLQNRSVQDIVHLFPGVTRGSSDSTQISIGGGTTGQIGYRVDASSVAIDRFKLISSGYGAEYGEQSSGLAEVVTNRAFALATGEGYAHREDNPFRRSFDEPLSTFAVDVDSASYSNVRRFLHDGALPPPGSVRVEELVNYFRYDDPLPRGSQPFAVTTELASCPWAPGHGLLRIALTSATMDDDAMPPRSLVFLVDVSGSMSSQDKLPLVKSSLRLLVDRLRPEDEVALVVYAGAAGLVLPLTNASEKGIILEAIDRLSSGGSTNGGDGIRLAYALAEKAKAAGSISRVILATDGDFNVGTTSEGDLVRLVESEREKDVFLTVLGFGTGNLQDSKMEALADHGNGNYAYVDSVEEARKVLDREASATLVTVAKDVKIQVEFNPAVVDSWRLVGYENRLLAAQDFDDDRKDAGDIGAGHHVTALYELVPAGGSVSVRAPAQEPLRYRAPAVLTHAASSGEVGLVRLRYKQPLGRRSRLLEQTVSDTGLTISAASENLRFAVAVASFGMLLRGTDGVEIAWPEVVGMARGSVGKDADGLRAQFVTLAETAQGLSGASEMAGE